MSVLLALGSAVTFGIADFLGGLGSRRAATWSVVVLSQFVGLSVLVLATPLLPDASVTASDLLWGAAAGLAGAVGLTQFYRALSVGTMSIVAPVAAVVNAGVPVVAGVALGERPAGLAWLGIALGLPAIILISREVADPERLEASDRALTAAVIAGLGFGGFFVFIDRTGNGAGIVPLIAARGASITVLASIGTLTHRFGAVRGRTVLLVAASGVLDMCANVLFLYAVREGLLALGSVISAMYPASTILLARVVLDERLQRVQVVGLLGAGVAVTLVALG